jgi:hypothetical protein
MYADFKMGSTINSVDQSKSAKQVFTEAATLALTTHTHIHTPSFETHSACLISDQEKETEFPNYRPGFLITLAYPPTPAILEDLFLPKILFCYIRPGR